MAIVKTMDIFPVSCVCVVWYVYGFSVALKEKCPMVIRVLFGIALQIFKYFSYFQIMFIVFL